MTDGVSYVLDANVFIEAARRYYAFDLVPAFWTKLEELAAHHYIHSIDRVKQELDRGKDELSSWAAGNFAPAFDSTDDEDIIAQYRSLMSWVQLHNQFLDMAKSDFAGSADGWLIAYAKVKGRTVVTHEVLAQDAKAHIPIPNVCLAFDVQYVDTFQMLRNLGVRLT